MERNYHLRSPFPQILVFAVSIKQTYFLLLPAHSPSTICLHDQQELPWISPRLQKTVKSGIILKEGILKCFNRTCAHSVLLCSLSKPPQWSVYPHPCVVSQLDGCTLQTDWQTGNCLRQTHTHAHTHRWQSYYLDQTGSLSQVFWCSC